MNSSVSGGLTASLAPVGMSSRILGSAFTPASIAGMQLWLDAAKISGNDGDPISTWVDQSGLGNNATGTGSTRPLLKKGANGINGQNVALYDGVDDVLTIPYNAGVQGGTSFTHFLVFKIGTLGTIGIFDNVRGAGWSYYYNPNHLEVNGGGAVTATDASVAGTPYVATRVNDPSNVNLWINGTIEGTSASAALSGTNPFLVGRLNDGFTFNGAIAEILVYNSALSTANRKKVENYLGAKYGVTITP